MRILTLLYLSLIISLSGCSWMGFGDDEESAKSETDNFSERQFYDTIERNLNAGNWDRAIGNLQALEAQFPFGVYAEQAQLNTKQFCRNLV